MLEVMGVVSRLVRVGLGELVDSTEEEVEVGVGVEDDDEGVVEGTALVEVTGGVLVGELLGDGLEVDGELVGVGVEETGGELGGVEDVCGDDEALDVNSKVSSNAHRSPKLNHLR